MMDGSELRFDDKVKVHVISDADIVIKKLYNIMDEAEETVDVYADFRGPTTVDDMEGGIGLYIAAQKEESKSGLLPKLQRRIYYSAKKI